MVENALIETDMFLRNPPIIRLPANPAMFWNIGSSLSLFLVDFFNHMRSSITRTAKNMIIVQKTLNYCLHLRNMLVLSEPARNILAQIAHNLSARSAMQNFIGAIIGGPSASGGVLGRVGIHQLRPSPISREPIFISRSPVFARDDTTAHNTFVSAWPQISVGTPGSVGARPRDRVDDSLRELFADQRSCSDRSSSYSFPVHVPPATPPLI